MASESDRIEIVEALCALQDDPARGVLKGDWFYRLSDGEIIQRREIPLSAYAPHLKDMVKIHPESKDAKRQAAIEDAIERHRSRTLN